jgi:Domain of Unknown Function (DUF928)
MLKWQYRLFYLSIVLPLIVSFSTITGVTSVVAAQPRSVKPSSFEKLITFFQRKPPKRPRTVRGLGDICLISPGPIGRMKTWHRRPLFIWQGEGKSIVVKSTKNDDLSWTAPIAEGVTSFSYPSDQSELKFGQTYSWQIANTKGVPQFGIVKEDEWRQLSDALTVVERMMKGQSVEDIALAKAEIFAEKDLWSDALQVLYEVVNPSTDFVKQRRSYIQDLCKPAEPVKPTTATAQF